MSKYERKICGRQSEGGKDVIETGPEGRLRGREKANTSNHFIQAHCPDTPQTTWLLATMNDQNLHVQTQYTGFWGNMKEC